jgi:hypothetical protein
MSTKEYRQSAKGKQIQLEANKRYVSTPKGKAAVKKYNQKYNRKYNYGVTQEQFDEMFCAQEGKCAICRIGHDELKYQLCVDHCHATGHIRGLLCRNCNVAVGKLYDSVQMLQRAIDYLNKSTRT